MHRDLKFANVIYHIDTKELRLLDWGLADYYIPNKEYQVRVASRYYKGPELLVDDNFYHYSLDIWSLGVMLAELIFKICPFFMGQDDADQLIKIMRVLGQDNLEYYLDKYNLKLPDDVKKLMKGQEEFKKLHFNNFINKHNEEKANPQAIDLLESMLRYDKNERITCKDAMKHNYFEPAREYLANSAILDI